MLFYYNYSVTLQVGGGGEREGGGRGEGGREGGRGGGGEGGRGGEAGEGGREEEGGGACSEVHQILQQRPYIYMYVHGQCTHCTDMYM